MSDCSVMRRKLVKQGKLDLITGEIRNEKEEWITEPCGTPLFGEQIKKGICRSCESGWTHENNYPVKGK